MALRFLGVDNTPNYIALKADIVANVINGASNVGATVYTTDDDTWYIIGDDLTLAHYHLPVLSEYDVALGRNPSIDDWNKFGYNADVSIGTETVWATGGSFTMLTSASTISISSSSPSDTLLGVGAQSILVVGIDENYVAQAEVFNMDGTDAVVSLSLWLGNNRVSIVACGATGWNVGDITITAVTGGSTQALVPAVSSITQQAIFHTQAGESVLMDWILMNVVKVSAGVQPIVTIKCFATKRDTNVRYEAFRHKIDTAVENTVELNMKHPVVIGEKSLIEWEITTDQNATAVSLRFSFAETS